LQVISRVLVLPNGQQFDLTDAVLEPRPRRPYHRASAQRRRNTH
jgi:hypothetical protein